MAAALSSKFLKGIGSLQSLRSTRVESASSVYQNGVLRSYSTTVPSDSDTHDDFKPTQKVPSGSSNSLKDIVENDVKENPVMIYMKGVPEAPQCGFSSLAVRVLQQYSVPISARNILEDQELKSAVKSFSHWPTFPQIFIKGEFIGGSDIILNMHKGGELEAKLKDVNQKSQDVGAAFPWIAWYIWKTRNEKIFNDKDITPMDTLHLAIEEAESWSLAQRMDTAPAPDEAAPHGDGNEDAHQPPHSRWRCQSDASWINERDRAGLGFVLLDADSPTFFGAKGVKCAISPLHAEVEGLLWAMQEILKLGYREIRFELDCEQLIKIIEEKDDWPSLASEIDEIKALSMEFTVCSFAYIPRVLNVCADSLAKGVAKGGRSRVFGFPFVNYFAPSWLAPYVS